MTDREIAEWLLSIGGKIRINNREGRISRLEDLPTELAIALNSTHYVFEPYEVGLESGELGMVLVEVDDRIDGVEVRVLPH